MLLLVLIVAVVVGLVVYILMRRRFTNEWKPEVVSEHQLAEGSQRGVISNGIHSTETGECVCVCVCLQILFTFILSIYNNYMPADYYKCFFPYECLGTVFACFCIVKVVKLFI